MLHTTEAFFYIKLIPSIRWFKDNYMQMTQIWLQVMNPL
jgi:hypothetical protein